MANNRLYLVFKPTGKKILLAKRMADEWYTRANAEGEPDLAGRLDAFFREAHQGHDYGKTSHRDDFALELETPVEKNTPLKI